jgi:hypothetical protein
MVQTEGRISKEEAQRTSLFSAPLSSSLRICVNG